MITTPEPSMAAKTGVAAERSEAHREGGGQRESADAPPVWQWLWMIQTTRR